MVADGDAAARALPLALIVLQVRYGAERVFSSEATNITDEDVDALIAKGEAATKELNDKLQTQCCFSSAVSCQDKIWLL